MNCDHIIGHYPDDGEGQDLVRLSRAYADDNWEPFNFCPDCGTPIGHPLCLRIRPPVEIPQHVKDLPLYQLSERIIAEMREEIDKRSPWNDLLPSTTRP